MGILLLLGGVLVAVGLWLWMAWANKGGRSWARIMATAFFVVLTAGGAVFLIKFGFRPDMAHVLAYVFLPVSWLTGLSAVVLLWQRSSSDYYTAVSNRPKATREASRKPHDQPAARQVTDPDPY